MLVSMHAFGAEMGMQDAKGTLEENENESAGVKLFLMEVKNVATMMYKCIAFV
jgi:hypothetical protein